MAIWWLIFCFGELAAAITVTWTRPEEPPTTQKEILKAIERHAFALEAAQYASGLFGVEIKLCPQAEFDPLIGEFTIPRMIAYSKYYNHDCIIGNDPSLKWWGKDDPPAETTPKPKPKIIGEGIDFLKFLWKLRTGQVQQKSDEVWLLDSDSLRNWFKGSMLYSLTEDSLMARSHAHLLLRQVNVMNGPDGEKDLKRMPQAVQGALVIVLPSYADWKQPGNWFDATWFKSAALPTSAQVKQNLQILLDSQKGALTIIVHEPTKEASIHLRDLQLEFGEDRVVSVTRVLPKGFSTLTLLKFIQKAARIVIDDRDSLGRIVLLSRGTDEGIERFYFGRTWIQNGILIVNGIIVIVGVAYLSFWIKNNYSAPLKEHLIRFPITAFFVALPIIILSRQLWPKKLIYFWYGVFDCGLEALFYGLVSMYLMASFITLIVYSFEKAKSLPREESEDEVPLNSQL
jgi:hypothetical protein